MSLLPMLDPSKKTVVLHFLRLCVSNFISFFSPVFSQPLYLSYFLFFSPYIVKILCFLSPLFLTTSIALLCLLLSIQDLNLSEEELEFYWVLFETSEGDAAEEEIEDTVDKFLIHGEDPDEKSETEHELSKTGEALFQEKGEFNEITAPEVEGREVKPLGGEPKKVVVAGEAESEEQPVLVRGESEANVGGGITPTRQHSWSFSSSGSMRKEKEWRRTLACKLFEERHNAGGGGGAGGEDGMDLLWEKYEDDLSQGRGSRRRERRKKGGGRPDHGPEGNPEMRQPEVEDGGEDEDGERMCCFQALNFSTGKMNLGLGIRPSVMAISRTVRGIGWLHRVRRHKKM